MPATLIQTNNQYNSLTDAINAASGVDYGVTAKVEVSGLLTDSSILSGNYPNGVLITPALGEAVTGESLIQGAGLYDTSSYVIEMRTGSPITFDGLRLTAGQYSTAVFRTDMYYPCNLTIKNSILRHHHAYSSDKHCVHLSSHNAHEQHILIENCILTARCAVAMIYASGGLAKTTLTLKNCTIIGANDSGHSAGGCPADKAQITLINCYVADTVVGSDFFGTAATLIHCASGDGSAYGTGALTNIDSTTALVDPAGGDWRIKAGSPLLGAGQNGGNIGCLLGLAEEEPAQPAISVMLTQLDDSVTDTVNSVVPTFGTFSSMLSNHLSSNQYGSITAGMDSFEYKNYNYENNTFLHDPAFSFDVYTKVLHGLTTQSNIINDPNMLFDSITNQCLSFNNVTIVHITKAEILEGQLGSVIKQPNLFRYPSLLLKEVRNPSALYMAKMVSSSSTDGLTFNSDGSVRWEGLSVGEHFIEYEVYVNGIPLKPTRLLIIKVSE